MQECFWWPGMTQDLRNHIKKCGHCRKYEAAPPVVSMKPLTCSGPGELLHVDFTSIEETVPLKEDPVIHNVLVLQDHFSKYIVAYVVKDQTAHTATETLRNGYFGLFGAPAYLVSDQGKAFTGHVIMHLCELYGEQKLRASPYHAQTNGQVERMNQTIIRMISAKCGILVFLLTMQTALFCITRCLHFSCRPRCALVWGTVVRGFARWDLC